MSDTKLLYLTDSYKQEAKAKVVEVKKQANQTGVILDQTIFYPQGGGQPSDVGSIEGKNGSIKVTQVAYNQGKPIHFGKLEGNLQKGRVVSLKLDWRRRYNNMRLHSAGHIVHEAVMKVAHGIEPIEGMHGIGGKLYLKYKGIIDRTLIPQIQEKTTEIVASNKNISTKLVSLKKLKKESGWVPKNLPKNKPLRIVRIAGFAPIPDGGTQVKKTKETGAINISDIDYENGHSVVKYQVLAQPKLPSTHDDPTFKPKRTLEEFASSITQLEEKHLEKLSTASVDQKEQVRIKYLGRRGVVNQLTKEIAHLPVKDRKEAGEQLNRVKLKIRQALLGSKTKVQSQRLKSWLDVTTPGEKPPQGHLHPITQAIEEITRIFENIGFTRVRFPEIDYDWYVFESLNMPPGHPARDEWETFFIDAPPHKKLGELVLTTHTSNGQVREMERVKKAPIRMINIAKCYRRQHDLTHTAMFHQFEGLVIDRGINIQHIKGTLDYFARKFYGPTVKSRIRPSMFRFTEPSFELDFSCVHCEGRGCRFCKSGWHEVGGTGMVHPNVLKAGGIDPEKYTGFAFGMGVERAYTLKPGLKLDDIRPLYSTNLDFLEQF